ncbi:MAG: LamG domain-containing protein, partial [Nanoarchaeota archaeon]|nr:LamG domain-containing protein [Nanoarchaeota archaeon]
EPVSESLLGVSVSGGVVTVTTDYSEIQEGFGKDYSGDESLDLVVSLDNFDLSFEQNGEISVSLEYEGEVIIQGTDEIIEEGSEEIGDVFGEVNGTRNETNSSIGGSFDGEIVQGNARIGECVPWVVRKSVEQGSSKVVFRIPEDGVVESAESISLEESLDSTVGISGNVVVDVDFKKESRFSKWLKGTFGITGNAVFNVFDRGNFREVEVDLEEGDNFAEVVYCTTAPRIVSELVDERSVTLEVSGSTDPEVHYSDVELSYVLPESFGDVSGKVKIRWVGQGIVDSDYNPETREISWLGQLSNQTFIIYITGAEHLDVNREFISDIYDEVSELDGIFSESILDGEYVRITFERELDSTKDITVYPRIVSGSPRMEIYEINGSQKVAEFTSLNEGENKVYLTGLVGLQDTFDLLILDGTAEFDYIVDPTDGAPDIEFVAPTSSGSVIGSIYVNVSSIDVSDHYTFVDMDRDLVTWLTMDRVNTQGDPRDSSSWNNNWQAINNARQNESGYWNYSFEFDAGVDEYIALLNPVGQSLNFGTGDFSYSIWVRTSKINTEMSLIGTPGSTLGQSATLLVNTDGRIKTRINDDADATNLIITDSGSTVVNDGEWHHVVVSFDRDENATIYIDGIKDISRNMTGEAGTINPSSQGSFVFRVGDAFLSSGKHLTGMLDEAMIFKRALTEKEVLALYNASENQYEN